LVFNIVKFRDKTGYDRICITDNEDFENLRGFLVQKDIDFEVSTSVNSTVCMSKWEILKLSEMYLSADELIKIIVRKKRR